MARISTGVKLLAVIALLAALGFGLFRFERLLFVPAPPGGGDSPAEVVGGSIHGFTLSSWTQVSPTQYYTTLPDGYTVDQIITTNVRGVSSPTYVSQNGWEVTLSSRNYSQAVSICSDPACSYAPVTKQQIWVNLSSANLFWNLASKSEIHFHDKACDKDATSEDSRCDFLSRVVIGDSTNPSLASGVCSRFPIFHDGHCEIDIGKPVN